MTGTDFDKSYGFKTKTNQSKIEIMSPVKENAPMKLKNDQKDQINSKRRHIS